MNPGVRLCVFKSYTFTSDQKNVGKKQEQTNIEHLKFYSIVPNLSALISFPLDTFLDYFRLNRYNLETFA